MDDRYSGGITEPCAVSVSTPVRAAMVCGSVSLEAAEYAQLPADIVRRGGRVLAQDIIPEVIERLADRVARERDHRVIAVRRRVCAQINTAIEVI